MVLVAARAGRRYTGRMPVVRQQCADRSANAESPDGQDRRQPPATRPAHRHRACGTGRARASDTQSTTAQDALRVGGKLGKYLITGKLGKGGMGVVYEAEDPFIKRRVAVKLLPGRGPPTPMPCSGSCWRRAAGRLNHPNTVAVFDVGEQGGGLLPGDGAGEGRQPADFLAQRARSPGPRRRAIIADACRGLEAAHAAGLIHRDIKPANIMRAGDGAVKLADSAWPRASKDGRIAHRAGASWARPST